MDKNTRALIGRVRSLESDLRRAGAVQEADEVEATRRRMQATLGLATVEI